MKNHLRWAAVLVLVTVLLVPAPVLAAGPSSAVAPAQLTDQLMAWFQSISRGVWSAVAASEDPAQDAEVPTPSTTTSSDPTSGDDQQQADTNPDSEQYPGLDPDG